MIFPVVLVYLAVILVITIFVSFVKVNEVEARASDEGKAAEAPRTQYHTKTMMTEQTIQS